jgi:two-component system phosphate regulon sensor histidine kinase PhoR
MILFAETSAFSWVGGVLIGMMGGIGGTLLWCKSQRQQMLARLKTGFSSIEKDDYVYEKSGMVDPISTLTHDFFKVKTAADRNLVNAREFGDRLNSVLNNMIEGVIVLDDRCRVIYANESSLSLLSVELETLQDRSFLEAVRNPTIEQVVDRCFSRKETVKTEFETIRGLRRTLALRASWMPSETRKRAMLVFNDVTNLRHLENMRRDFVANVSHELKTPLASIKAYSETLRMGGLDDLENRVGFVATIEEQANRLHQLIIDLIHLGRIEEGRTAFQITNVDMCSLLEERVQTFRDDARKAQIMLEIDTPEEEIWGRADDEGMQTIIDNLISNAIRYTPPEGRVLVSCKTNGDHVTIEVSDTGIGIAPEQQERVFERFYRVDKARSREKGGTGLGLSIVKHLVQSFGGKMTLKSTIGRGSTFSVSVPLATSQANLQA